MARLNALNGVSDLLRGAFDSRTRDAIFKDEQRVFDFFVLHEFGDGFVMEGVATCFFYHRKTPCPFLCFRVDLIVHRSRFL